MAVRRKADAVDTAKSASAIGPYVPPHELARERIAEDMAAFEQAGGQIEVLGNTPLRVTTKSARSTTSRVDARARGAPAAAGPDKT